MLMLCLLLIFFAVFAFVLGVMPVKWEDRPTLKVSPAGDFTVSVESRESKNIFRVLIRRFSVINKAISIGLVGQRITKDLGLAQIAMTADEFLLVKEVVIALLIGATIAFIKPGTEIFIFGILMSIAGGYYVPELWLKSRKNKVRDAIVKDLPDTVDLLGLCVNAGLDFMMALKYVVEKSNKSMMAEELRSMMQEINMGKPRRDALRDMARRRDLPDLSTFSRTLIQADRMGTSVTEALNILSEDMRDARFRRGEAMAMKAPLKMLIPLLLFIFPVVAVLVAGPVFLDFFQNNPMQNLGK